MSAPFWLFCRVQVTSGTLVGVLSAAVFFLLSHDLPTGPLVTWTVLVCAACTGATTLAGAAVLWRRVVVRDDSPGEAGKYPRDDAFERFRF